MSRTIKDILALFPETTKKDWKQHARGDGWVCSTAHAHESSFIEGIVCGNARVYGNAWVSGDAQVYGNARVSGDAWVASPPYIQGSRHALTLCSLTQIAIGCHVHDIAEWLKRYRAIGCSEGYTKDQIAEYGLHLSHLAALAKKLQAAAKKTAKKEVAK